ncbi:unnamed protein product [Rhizophagus irregularis]|uniref:Uncharacterized protein n=1 Tax=Rhizophagus irregularis TaxID=588596 RepID=A0A915ZKR4_9GLOM|nr:unnamed protein product [Rhizophagus irregularis]
MDTSKQNSDTTKTDAKNLWKKCDVEYQKKEKKYTDNDFLNEIKYYISETISSSSANPISECLDCELNELDLNQDDDE